MMSRTRVRTTASIYLTDGCATDQRPATLSTGRTPLEAGLQDDAN